MSDTANTKLSCNRKAFQNDSSCYRGDVDIDAFLDFPICEVIAPDPPDTAFPVVDYPVVPFTPPPCACINIDYKVKRKDLENRDDIYLKIDFRSVGDCCEGNYETDIDLRIPCIPFKITGGSSSVAIDIEDDCTLSSPVGTFNLGLSVESCEINIDPQIQIRIPKPKELQFKTEVTCRTLDCFESASPGASFTMSSSSNDEECTRTIVSKLNIRMPHVANLIVCDSSSSSNVDMKGEDGKKLGGKGKLSMNTDEDSCGFAIGLCPKLELDLPCPIKGKKKIKLKAKVGWGDSGASDSASLAEKSSDSCALTCGSGSIDLHIPCPFGESTQPLKVGANIGWGSGPRSGKVTLATFDHEKCQVTFGASSSTDIDLELPCPLNNLNLIGDEPGNEPYVNVSKVDTGNESCAATWMINLHVPGKGGSSSSDSESSSSSSSKSSESSDSSAASSPWSSYASSSSNTSGSSGSSSAPAATDYFTAVTGVDCDEKGGIAVQTTTFTIDFTNHCIYRSRDVDGNSEYKAKLARQLLVAAVKAINDDPALMDVVNDPYSENAEKALAGIGIGEIDDTSDDELIEDFV